MVIWPCRFGPVLTLYIMTGTQTVTSKSLSVHLIAARKQQIERKGLGCYCLSLQEHIHCLFTFPDGLTSSHQVPTPKGSATPKAARAGTKT